MKKIDRAVEIARNKNPYMRSKSDSELRSYLFNFKCPSDFRMSDYDNTAHNICRRANCEACWNEEVEG